MSTWDMVLIGANSLFALGTLWPVLCATNNMTRRTPFSLRTAFISMGIGAFAALLTPFYLDRAPTAAEVLLCAGMATLAIADRRRASRKWLAGHLVTGKSKR